MPVSIAPLAIPDVRIVRPRRFADARGHFVEMHNRGEWAEAGIDVEFVQDNQSLSRDRGTVRGLHFQIPPFAQAKAVWVIDGRILDIVVDVRRGSPTFGRHAAIELGSDTDEILFVPVGFAHGFVTLVPDTRVAYKVSAPYAPDHDRGILWSDPALGIDWPMSPEAAVGSDKDRRLPRLADIEPPFVWGQS